MTAEWIEQAKDAHLKANEEFAREMEARVAKERADNMDTLERLIAEALDFPTNGALALTDWNADGTEATLDGVRFALWRDRDSGSVFYKLTIIRDCPDCDGTRRSFGLKTLKDVGAVLSDHGMMQYHEHYHRDDFAPEEPPELKESAPDWVRESDV